MIMLTGYVINERLYQGKLSVIYRGKRVKDAKDVVVKVPLSEFPSSREIERFQHEFEMACLFQDPHIHKYYALEPYQQGFALIEEDYGAISLAEFNSGTGLELGVFLNIASQLATGLGVIHGQGIIHKDIKPGNILINSEHMRVKYIGLGIASQLKQEILSSIGPGLIEGSLPYISPEQTGRMNRAIDCRTDFYSLGMTFYELLTGLHPFESQDPLELIHSHIAKLPVPPSEVRSELPSILSDLVMKLLSKNPDERYQSASGLLADLNRFKNQLEHPEGIMPFSLGQSDYPAEFFIPQKLYGRDTEIKIMLKAFEEALRGLASILLVSGYAGVGKTAFVNEIQKHVTIEKGFLASGKFEQFGQNLAYTAITQAFRQLVRQILGGDDKLIKAWREKLLEALEPNGQVIVSVIPELALIIGEQPDVPVLGPAETQNRFNLVFSDFVSIFAQPEHPLVLFIDDLQWADHASLNLLQKLMTGTRFNTLLLIGTYRENEVDAIHPTNKTVEDMVAAGVRIQKINLSPLSKQKVSEWVAETLRSKRETSTELSDMVYQKTGGNPFFVRMFLQSLYDAQLLIFEDPKNQEDSGGWKWDLEKIQQMQTADNVAELLSSRINQLSKTARKALKVAACIGNTFTLEILSEVLGEKPEKVFATLNSAFNAGMLYLFGNDIRFSHDRIQDAAYAMIPEFDRQETHMSIGRILRDKSSNNEQLEDVFNIVKHLNLSATLVNSQEERSGIARLNLLAALKTKISAAYDMALLCLEKGMAFLPSDAWESEYDLALNIYTEAAQMSYLVGKHEQCEIFLERVMEKAQKPLDKVAVFEIKIVMKIILNQYQEALETAHEALEMLGMEMPAKGDQNALMKEIGIAKGRIGDRAISDLIHLPELKDANKLAIARLLMTETVAAYIGDPDYFPVVVLKLLNLSLEYGNSTFASYAYVVFGMLSSGALKAIDEGYEFGRLALNVLEKFNATELQAKIYHLFWGFINYWKQPIRPHVHNHLEGYHSGVRTGDLEFACYHLLHYTYNCFLAGEPLDNVLKKQTKYYEVMQKYQQRNSLLAYQLWYQFVKNLHGTSGDKTSLEGDICDVETLEREWIETHNVTNLGVMRVCQQILFYLFGNYEKAIQAGRQAAECLPGMMGMLVSAEQNFFESLALLAHYPQVDALTQKEYRKRVVGNQEQMKIWATNAPMNFEHKYLLIEAECNLFKENFEDTVHLYDKALKLSGKHDFIQVQAIAYELAAKFYLNRKLDAIARFYMRRACYCFRRWGAERKARDLEQTYPNLLGPIPTEIEKDLSESTTVLQANLDLDTVIKAYNAISSEIDLDKLLITLMEILMKNAGAQRGSLVLVDEDHLSIKAQKEIDQAHPEVLPSIHLTASSHGKSLLATEIAQYVAHTRESVVLDDALESETFANTEYVTTKRPKSILCSPLISHGEFIGLIYLENNLVTKAFTSERVELVRLLGLQAGISIVNAKAIAERVRSEKKYRTLFEKSSDAIFILNKSTGQYLDANSAGEELTGRKTDELKTLTTHDVSPVGASDRLKFLKFSKNITDVGTVVYLRPDGSRRIARVEAFPLDDGSAIGISRDITQELEAESRLRQSQKMEAIGALTSGISHDFNNILSSILGYSELGMLKTDSGEFKECFEAIHKSGERGRDLVKQILTFSRGEANAIKAVKVDLVINEALKLLRPSIPSSIDIQLSFNTKDQIIGDPTQIHQVVMNLCTNASQAMPSGGILDISLDIEVLGGQTADTAQLSPGKYLKLTVSDSGCGISADHINQIFEPYFTTKGKDKGTGLGLSVVYGIVKSHEGDIIVKSEAGKGSSFIVWLPVAEEHNEAGKPEKSVPQFSGGDEHILLVDDEQDILDVTKMMLEMWGYQITTANSAIEALSLFKDFPQKFDLVISDMIMPKMDGFNLVKKLRILQPGIKVIIFSGNAKAVNQEVDIISEDSAQQVNGYLSKPINMSTLAKAVREVLDSEKNLDN